MGLMTLQLLVELRKNDSLDSLTFLLGGVLRPDFLESKESDVESIEDVVVRDVVFFKLLDNNKDEEIEHD